MTGWLLVVLLIVAIVFIVVGTARWKIHPFLVLLAAAYGLGLLAGIGPNETIKAITDGFGGTIGYIGIIIAAGTVIGIVLEKTGAAQVMANRIISIVGQARSAFAMSITGAAVSVPVFCDSGFVILSPLARSLAAKAKRSMAVYAVALSMGLYATHVFIPPTPGPIAAAGTLKADIGLVMLLGLVVTIPVLLATYVYAVWMGDKIYIDPDSVSVEEDNTENPSDEVIDTAALPETWRAFLPILLPIGLIALNSIASLPSTPFGEGVIASVLKFLGNPNTALLIGVVVALTVTARKAGPSLTMDAVSRALKVAGPIILITGAGGALGSVLRQTPITDFLGNNLALTGLGIFLPFFLAAALKTAQGSSTVAIVTTAGIISPLVIGLGLDAPVDLALTTLAIGAGSMTVSHANDSYFWVVSQFSGMSVSQAYKLQTISSAVAGISGIITIYVISLIL